MRRQYPTARWIAAPTAAAAVEGSTRAAVQAFVEDEPGWELLPVTSPDQMRVVVDLDDRPCAFVCDLSDDQAVLTLWSTIVDPVPRRRSGQMMRLLNELNGRARMGAFVLDDAEAAVRWRACVHLGLPGACVAPDACLLRPLFYLSALYSVAWRPVISALARGLTTLDAAMAVAMVASPARYR